MQKKAVFAILFALVFMIQIFAWMTYEPRAVPGEQRAASVTTKASDSGTVSFTITPPSFACNMTLKQGWNLISLCAEPSNKSIASVLSSIDYRYVLQWNATSQSFDVYSPQSSGNKFTTFDTNQSYFVYVSSAGDSDFGFIGDEFGDKNVSMIYGWDTPTYPYQFSSNITKYLDSIANKYRYLMKWNASEQLFMIYSPRQSEPLFMTIYMGEGQFINVNDAGGATLKYNKTELQSG
jgi:hypothetical protein